MLKIRGCLFPSHLLYDVRNHIWYEMLDDGSFRVGMDSVAIALAGDLLAFTPRRAGRPLEAGKACAVLESGKWVGAARIIFDGVVESVNDAMINRPSLANRDPYGEGYLLVARPFDMAPVANLVTGDKIDASYRAWMDQNNFPGCEEP